jgi:hypothetical protein
VSPPPARAQAADLTAALARSGRVTLGALLVTVVLGCDVGGRPGYFVPSETPPALLGCARLGLSGKRVEFSGSLSRVDGAFELCINPAYSGRGRRGFFIPSLCKLSPPPSRFAVRDARQPRQGVRGYRYVIWGTAPRATREVVARFASGSARAAVFRVPSRRAPWSFGERPFGLFVLELPTAAACGTVTVTGDGPGARDRVGPQSC